MTYELYFISGSPFAWRALLALEIKGVEYESKLVKAMEEEHKQPWFLEMNPRGKVPVLKIGNRSLYETHAILAYLEGAHAAPPLFGAGLDETTLIWRLLSEVDAYFVPASIEYIRPVLFAGLEEASEELRAAALPIHKELKVFEKELADSGKAYLAGDTVSAADIALYPFLKMLLRAAGKVNNEAGTTGFTPFAKVCPKLDAWMGRIEALPGYQNTYPPHWRQ